MKPIGISITFIVAVFVFISCTPKDRTARINEIYEEYVKESPDETKDESKTPDENLEPDDEQIEEDVEITHDEDVQDNEPDELDEDTQDFELIDDLEMEMPDEPEPFCGDGNKDQGEDCDLGTVLNTGEYGGCNSDCTLAIRCGDGIKNGPEICDDGQNNGTSRFCNASCTGATTGALCTGQTKCYNETEEITCPSSGDFYGQDAQYLDKCIPRSYTISGTNPQEIVTDNNTGLQWQRTLPTTYAGCTGGNPAGSACTWQQALDYCENLVYGGYSNWTLPDYYELMSIIKYSKLTSASSVSVYDEFFQDISQNTYWSASVRNGIASNAWGVSFFGGRSSNMEKTNYLNVICSIENGEKQTTLQEENISGEIILKNLEDNLFWTKQIFPSMNWKNALNECESLVYAGFSDWRLPNINELKTLVNISKSSPASDFPSMIQSALWSSTSIAGYSWAVYFGNGEVLDYSISTSIQFMQFVCVR